MGLDMYLTARRYVSQYSEPALQQKLAPLADECLPPDGNMGAIQIERDVAYWRKANHIHNWFVQNVQGGQDDCNSYDVSIEQLEELRSTCEKALQCVAVKGETVTVDEERVSELLPTKSGFFFGGTDYDQWYVEDLKSTVSQLDKVLAWVRAEQLTTGKEYINVDLQYRSSW